jgi:hypothetical protein
MRIEAMQWNALSYESVTLQSWKEAECRSKLGSRMIIRARQPWLMPVVLVTQDAEVRKITVQS